MHTKFKRVAMEQRAKEMGKKSLMQFIEHTSIR